MPADRTRHSRRVQLKAMGHESKPMVKPRAGLSTNSISPPPRRKGTDCVATQKLPRTPNKFMCFRSSALAQMQYKGALQHHLSIKIAKLWNIMSEEQREPFKKQADKLKSDQLEALASAKSNPTPPRTGGPTMTAESHYRGVQWTATSSWRMAQDRSLHTIARTPRNNSLPFVPALNTILALERLQTPQCLV
ncbi:hypothetical protein B0H17DRAFT_636878 [Mycena rosella]|uniref:HMG box domain-containing protein n=1 Tax=Mycena rosella TaxID=1033263 RepID=A0AAD7DE10_MYCRO|nr:hypothetical protein B0H17DRAFT_636878 [Mycena rosella]